MHRLVVLLSVACIACSPPIEAYPADGPGAAPPLGEDVLPGSYLVYTADDGEPDGLLQSMDVDLQGLAVTQSSDASDFTRVWRVHTEADWGRVHHNALNSDGVVHTEPERLATASGLVPDDPFFSSQWHLADIGLPAAWEHGTGNGVTVAVLDTGVSEGTDGYGRLLAGRDFADNDDDPSDHDGHGTHVAGTIGQATDNGYGTAGVAPGAAILPVRVLGASGSGSLADVADGIVWATDQGADVINLSLGAGGGAWVLESAIDYAVRNGVVVVAASGNDGRSSVDWPAAYDNAIAVGAVDAAGRRAPYSNGGSALDIVAPGGDTGADLDGDGYVDGVLQETWQDGSLSFWFLQGTSMATPHVAGVAALLVEQVGNDPEKVRDLLLQSAQDADRAGFDTSTGWGTLDAQAALALAVGDGGSGTETESAVETERSGLVRLTEFLADPATYSDTDGEWVEVWNDTDEALALDRLALTDASGNGGWVDSDVVLQPGDVAVLGRAAAWDWPWSGIRLDGSYPSSLSLNNGGDDLTLWLDAEYADGISYPSAVRGSSWAYQPEAGQWELSSEAIPGTYDKGSPGHL